MRPRSAKLFFKQFFIVLTLLSVFVLSNINLIAQTPGGVTGATVWFKANAGTTLSGSNVTAWANNGTATAAFPNVSNSTVARQPTLTASAINFDPAISFSTSTGQYLMQSTSFARTSIIALKNYTYFEVLKRHASASNSALVVWHHGATGTVNKFGYETTASVQSQYTNNVASFSAGVTIPNGVAHLHDVSFSGGTSTGPLSYSLNGNNFSTVTVANLTSSSGRYSLGADQADMASWNWQGDMAELIMFPATLSGINMAQVRSYLALKYGITLSNNADNDATVNETVSGSVKEGDYVLGDGTTKVWDYAARSSYSNNIAGIVSDVTSAGLLQKQSQSINAGIQVAVGLGSIAATNAANSNSFAADKNAMVWGDNAGSTNFLNTVSGSALVNYYMSRVWQVQETGTVGSVTVSIPSSVFTGQNKAMIVSSSSTFASGNSFVLSTGTQTINGVLYETFPFNFTSAQYFSFATYIPLLSGSVFNDANGTGNGLIDGTLISTAAGLQLYANLVNRSTGLVVGSEAVSGGTYTLDATNGMAVNTNFDVVISTVQGVIGTTTGAASLLPAGWMNTAEGSGTGDGTNNGLVAANVITSDITSGLDFGITQAGYIYIHKKTLNEESSVDFTFTGDNGLASFTLNDNPAQISLKDIGASQGGRLWAIGSTNNTLYYRNINSSTWVQTSVTTASRVDGGAANTCYVVSTTGSVIYFDGTTSTTIGAAANYGSSNASDIGSTWDNRPYIVTAAGRIYRYSGSGTTWAQVGATTNNRLIDGNPANGNIIVSKTDHNVYSITSAAAETSLGRPVTANTADATDVAVDDNGNIYSLYQYLANGYNTGNVAKWTSGTTWGAAETATRYANNITAGLGEAVWALLAGTPGTPFNNIFTRSSNGSNTYWIDDERVRTSPASGNSQMIAVVPGTYTVTETVPASWDLQSLTVYDPGANSTINLPGKSVTLVVAADETVHAIFQNGIQNSYAVASNCGTIFTENFGTGTAGTYGSALTGQTSYHYMNTATAADDGYYKVVGATSMFASWATSINDHTANNGQGRMMVVNAAYDQNEFYRRRFTGLIAGSTYTLSAWIANIGGSGTIKPNVAFKAIDPSTYSIANSNNTGNITTAGTWTQYSLSFVASAAVMEMVLQNNNVGGDGNDLAIDDITLSAPVSAGGTVSSAQLICAGSTPADLTLSGNTGAVIKWQYSADNFASSSTDIPSSALTTLTSAQIGALTADRYFRAVVQNGSCATAYSTTVLITVNAASVGGSIAPAQAIAYGTSPADLTLAGHTGAVAKWEYSTDNFGTSSSISGSGGITTLTSAQMGALTANRYYRADVKNGVCAGTVSSIVLVTVVTNISGTVYNDANGLTDNTVNGAVYTSGGLNAILYDNTTGMVAAVTAVAANGTYSFAGASNNTHTVYITGAGATVGQTSVPALTLPAGWVYTGEKIGAGTGSDGTADGILSLGTITTALTNVNIGIERIPAANGATAASQQNPGGNAKVLVPTLTGSDPDDGSYPGTGNLDTVIIKTLPVNGTLYYNNVAVTAGDTIKNYTPSLLLVNPNDGISSLSFTYSEIDKALQGSTPAAVTMPFTTGVPVPCINKLYELSGTGSTSVLRRIEANTGAIDTIATYAVQSNAAEFNPADNFIWAVQNANTLVRIDANGVVQTMNVPNLTFASGPNVGAISPAGYYYVAINAAFAGYYVVDVNPSRSTYLQIVNPATFAAIASPPYYTVPSITGVGVADWAWNPADGKLWGMSHQLIGGTPVNQARLLSMNPATGSVVMDAPVLNPVLGNLGSFGSVIIDATGYLYARQNSAPGRIYKVNMVTGASVPLATANVASSNDAAICPAAALSYFVGGTVSNDINGLTDNTVNGAATNAGSTLNAILYNNTTGRIDATAAVTAGGTYVFGATPGNSFTVYITTAVATVGQTTVPASTLPATWEYTGEKNGSGAGSDGTPNGILIVGSVNADISNANFGIERIPVSNDISTTTCGTASMLLPTLNGNDAEDGAIGNGGAVAIITLPPNGTLKYNNVNVTAGQTINSYNASLLTLIPDAGAAIVTFIYCVKDAAAKTSSTAATVTITVTPNGQWTGGASGDWNIAGNWCGGVPTSTTNVIIPSGSTVYIQSAYAEAYSVAIAAGAGLVMTGPHYLHITGNGSFTNNGTFNATASTGMVSFEGNATVNGTITFRDIRTFGALDFGTASTIAGNFYLFTNGSVTGHSPFYTCPGSVLQYRTGATFTRGLEWTGNSSGAGYPANVQIGANTTVNFPTNGNGYICNDLAIESGSGLLQNYSGASASLHVGRNVTIGGTLELGSTAGGDIYAGGNWTRFPGGIFRANGRRVTFDGPSNFSGNGTSMSTITAPASAAKDNDGGFGGENFAHIWINKTNATDSVVLLSNITVTHELGLTKGTFSLGNNDVTLVSNNSRTADIAPVSNTADVAIRYTGTGKFAVQRFIPNPTSGRSWRLLTAPLQDGTAPSVNEAWQEGVVNPDKNAPGADGGAYNPWPGYGTHITGPGGLYSAINGFDQGTNSSSVMYMYLINGLTAWATPASTIASKITGQQGWMLFVRGDRGFRIGNQYVPAENTTLEPKGRIHIGDVTVPVSAGRQVIGNPYASAISLVNVDMAGTSGGNSTYHMWDPKMFTSFSQTGKWVTFTGVGSSFVQTTSESAYPANGKVESGQAFVVDVNAGGGNIVFHESDKLPLAGSLIGIANSNASRPVALPYALFRTDMYVRSDTTYNLTDGVLNIFADPYNNAADNEDARKFSSFNTKESMSILRDTVKLAIEKRSSILESDTIFYNLSKFNELPYRFRFMAEYFAPGMEAFLQDNFTGTLTPVSTNGATSVDFTITANPASKAADRFRVIFKQALFVLPVTFTNVKAWAENKDIAIQWDITNEINVHHYEVERSANGTSFEKINSSVPAGNDAGSKTYHWLDKTAAAGDNYYRIISVDVDGKKQYSKVVKVTVSNKNGSISLYNNPVTGTTILLRFNNMEKGSYTARLLGTSGQQQQLTAFEHDGSNSIKEMPLPSSMPKGIYNLEIRNASGETITLKAMIK